MCVAQPTVGDYFHGRTCPGLDMVAKFESALAIEHGSLVDDQPLRLLEIAFFLGLLCSI